MTASDRNNRRAEKAELARHIATDETVAFMTALVAFLNEAHTTRHHDAIEAQPPSTDSPSAPDSTPVEAAPGEHQPAPGVQHSDAVAPSSDEVSAARHADAAIVGDIPDSGGSANVAAATESHVTASVPAGGPAAASAPVPTDHLMAAGDGSTHAEAATSSAVDPAASILQLGTTITHLVDTSLAVVSHTLESLGTTVAQLTSSVTGTIGQLADNVTGLLGGIVQSAETLTHEAPATHLFDALVTDIVSSPLAAPHDGAPAHEIGALDTAGAVPMAALPPLTLHLGFLGQPTSDGHEIHDGAFSALGVHHF
ncbi:hypothetical protein IVB18_22020 [Bradyrhizobium sp. 186]|uniref:hypothetical protein n=1 Tax=Bradyrhizobium sp. 186 TaxID=2782654 RepID=UPI00200157E0|nr:hypothetical protein [Bradyrhizobium sp. 186]UPK39660.1 hypothetical protein IVB18_22020 [Bradyrhizobium sp. 186]